MVTIGPKIAAMDISHPLEKAIAHCGLYRLARELNLTHQALRKWQRIGRLPRTEWTGETTYAEQIVAICGKAVTVDELKGAWPAWPPATSTTTEPAQAGV